MFSLSVLDYCIPGSHKMKGTASRILLILCVQPGKYIYFTGSNIYIEQDVAWGMHYATGSIMIIFIKFNGKNSPEAPQDLARAT